MNRKTIERAKKLFALAENNPNKNEAEAAREQALTTLREAGMTERLFRTILKHRRVS